MRYSPYVTYGHQGLVLGQHPAQPLSGNSSVLLDLQFLFKDHYSAKDYTPQSILALKGIQKKLFFFYPQTPPVEITQFQWFRQIIPIQTQIWRELRITSSCRCLPCATLAPSESSSVLQLSLFRSQPLQLCRQAWALGGFLKSGKMLFNSTPFYHRYHKN